MIGLSSTLHVAEPQLNAVCTAKKLFSAEFEQTKSKCLSRKITGTKEFLREWKGSISYTKIKTTIVIFERFFTIYTRSIKPFLFLHDI
jgi:hypothetical protein